MASQRTTFTLDDQLADRARQLSINISAAARDGVVNAVRVALAARDQAGYVNTPESIDTFWVDAETWVDE